MGRTLNRSMIRVVLAVDIAAIAVQAELASSSSSSALSSSSSNAVLSSSSSAGLTALVMTPLKVDGIMGHHTTENLQYFLSDNVDCQKPLSPDGDFGKKTKMELQSFLNMMGTGQKLTLDGDFGQASNKVLKKYLKVEDDDLTPTQAVFDGIVDPAIIKGLQPLQLLQLLECRQFEQLEVGTASLPRQVSRSGSCTQRVPVWKIVQAADILASIGPFQPPIIDALVQPLCR